MAIKRAIEIVIGAAVIIRATENAKKTPMGITIIHPAAVTIIALVVPHTDKVIEKTRPNGLGTKAEAGNAAQAAMTPNEVHPQNRLSLVSRLSRFSVSQRWQQMTRRKKESE